MKKITLQAVKEILFTNYAKSSYYKNSFVNLISGIYFDKKHMISMISFECRARAYDFRPHGLMMLINTAIDSMPEIERYQAEKLNNRLWMFFRAQFNGQPSFKMKGYSLYKKYQKEFGNVSAKKFYTDLNAWAAEHKYCLTYRNRLINRWVVVSV